MFLQGLFNFKL